MNTVSAVAYIDAVTDLVDKIRETQLANLDEAARLISDSLAADGVVFTFGSGHSYSLALEAFSRAGGLGPVQLIVSPALAMVEGAERSSRVERLTGFAEALLPDYDLRQGDVLIVISNSGRNAVAIEAALHARELGLKIIAITNVEHSRSEPSRHASGKRLMEIADVVLDTCGVHGDAILEIPGVAGRVAPTSTVAGAIFVNALVAQVAQNLAATGISPPILVSANIDTPAPRGVAQAWSDRTQRPIKHR